MPKSMPNKNHSRRNRRSRPYPQRSARQMRSGEPPAQPGLRYGQMLDIRRTNVFPLRHRCTLRYADDVDLGVIGSTPVAYVLAANGLYDPDITGTGHQPMGFDQLMAFFQHYVVVSAKITAQFLNADAQQLSWAALSVNRGSSALTVPSRILENGNCTYSALDAGAAAGGNVCSLFFRNSVKIADFQSVPDVLNDDTLRGTAGANPSTLVSFIAYAWAGGTTSGHCHVSFIIEYDAVFLEPLQVAQS